MEWTYNNASINDEMLRDYVAFVYLIENTKTGRKYIGKKRLFFVSRKKVKGRKNRKVVKKHSDWKTYYGSNKTLETDRLLYGDDVFKRTILCLCKSLGEASYHEDYPLFERIREKWFFDKESELPCKRGKR